MIPIFSALTASAVSVNELPSTFLTSCKELESRSRYWLVDFKSNEPPLNIMVLTSRYSAKIFLIFAVPSTSIFLTDTSSAITSEAFKVDTSKNGISHWILESITISPLKTERPLDSKSWETVIFSDWISFNFLVLSSLTRCSSFWTVELILSTVELMTR